MERAMKFPLNKSNFKNYYFKQRGAQKLRSILSFVIATQFMIPAHSMARGQVQAVPLEVADPRAGLELLFKDQKPHPLCSEKNVCPDQISLEKLSAESQDIRAQYDELTKNYEFKDLEWKTIDKYTRSFTLSSPLQRENSKNNKIYGFLYTPEIDSQCSQVKFPATLFLHHVDRKIDAEMKAALEAAKNDRGITMLIYLPGYGPRAESESSPLLAPDIQEFKTNLLQSLTDIHVSSLILKDIPQVDSNRIQLGGLSLGAIIAALYLGYDSRIFSNYLIGLGGGDLARVLTLDKKTKTTENVRVALQNIDWNVDEARSILAPLDPLTWVKNVHNKRITIINNRNDELVDHVMGFKKFVDNLDRSNKVKIVQNEGSHVPSREELGLFKGLMTYFSIKGELTSFLGPQKSIDLQRCRDPY